LAEGRLFIDLAAESARPVHSTQQRQSRFLLADYIPNHDGDTDQQKESIMKRLFAVVLAVACVAGSTSVFARGGMGHGAGLAGRGGHAFNPALLQNPAPQMPTFENRIPAPLSSPGQAPLVNGPMSQPAFRGMTGIGQ
jgi:hypothetical protein